jgi:excisionase family DNA binding protein
VRQSARLSHIVSAGSSGNVTERLVTARELAELLSLAPGTVLDQWEAGKLPGYKIGRAVRFDPDEIHAMTRRSPAAGDIHREN